jgi:hypothetical protein
MITRHLRHRLVVTLLSFFAGGIGPTSIHAKDALRFIFSEDIGFGHGTGLGQFSSPSAVAIGDLDRDGWPDLFVADTGNNRLQRANFNTPTGDPDFDLIAGPGSALGQLVAPKGIDVDTQRGLLFIADTGNNRIQRAAFACCSGDPDFDLIAEFGTQLGQVNAPEGVDFSGGGGGGGADPTQPDLIYVADTGNNRIQLGTRNAGSLTFDWRQLGGPGTDLGQVDQPTVIVEPNDVSEGTRDRPPSTDEFIADTGNNRIQRMTMNHVTGDAAFDLVTPPPGGWSHPEGLAACCRIVLEADLDGDGQYEPTLLHRIFVADTGNNRILTSIDYGLSWTQLAGPGSGPGQVMSPRGMAVGDFTRDGRPDLIVADTGNNRILVFAGIPEPSTLGLAAFAMGVLAIRRRRMAG